MPAKGAEKQGAGLEKTKGILERIHDHPDASAAAQLAAAMALDYLNKGDVDKAMAVIDDYLMG